MLLWVFSLAKFLLGPFVFVCSWELRWLFIGWKNGLFGSYGVMEKSDGVALGNDVLGFGFR